MTDFIPFIRGKLENNGYRTQAHSATDLIINTPDHQSVWVFYADQPLEPEQIRRCLEFPGHLLFVVNEKLIPDEIESREKTPMWLRVLHGLYMGRIYTWNGRFLFGLHFDYDTGDVSESSAIDPIELLLVETGTWLRGWTDFYKLARFYDRAWWVENNADSARYHYQDQKARTSQSDWQREYQGNWYDPNQEPSPNGGSWYQYTYGGTGEQKSSNRQSAEDAAEAFKRAWEERFKEQFKQKQQSAPPKSEPPKKRDFLREFLNCGNKAAAKSLYRNLSKEFHPDLNPGKDTTSTMQEINGAWMKAEKMMV